MKKDNDALESAREIINQVDKEMASLFEKRMQAVKEIAEYKKQRGEPCSLPFSLYLSTCVFVV